jgi:MFS family permease
MANSAFYGWRLLAVFWLILFVILGFPPYGSGVINTYMFEQLGFDRTMLGVPYSVFMLMSGLPAPLVAMLVNRKGVRFALVTGSLVLLAGSLFMALFVASLWGAILGGGILVGSAVAIGGMLPAQTSTALWFQKRRALAVSIVLSAGGIGGYVAPRLLNYVIEANGGDWRAGWWVFAGLAVASALTAALFVKEKPSDLGQYPDGIHPDSAEAAARQKHVHQTTEAWTEREALRSPTFWLLLFCASGMSMGYTWALSHGIAHLQDLGHSKAVAAAVASWMAGTTLLGKFLVGSLGDRIELRFLFAAAIALFGTGLVAAMHAEATGALCLYAIGLGIGWGGALTCLMTILGNYFGTKAYPAAVGVAVAVQTTAASISPSAAGYLYDLYGSYAPTVYPIAALCFLGALLLIRARPPRRPVPATAGAAAPLPNYPR